MGMFNIFSSSVFTKVKKTSVVEQNRANLNEQYKKYIKSIDSEILKNYLQLQEEINSQEFIKNKKQIIGVKYNSTEEFKSEKEYLTLKKSKELKNHNKFKNSKLFVNYSKVNNSNELADCVKLKEELTKKENEINHLNSEINTIEKSSNYKQYKKYKEGTELKKIQNIESSFDFNKLNTLKETIESSSFFQEKKALENEKKYKNSELQNQEKEYNSLLNNADYKFYLKTKTSNNYKNFVDFVESNKESILGKNKEEINKLNNEKTSIENKIKAIENKPEYKDYIKVEKSKELKVYNKFIEKFDFDKLENLENYINSQEFKSKKAFYLNKKRYLTTQEYKKEEELKKLENSEEVKVYKEFKDSDKFKDINKWELVFSDNFDNSVIDNSKWLTKNYWSDKLKKGSYSLENEFHIYSDRNVKVEKNNLIISTKNESQEGLAWSDKMGFFKKKFDFTSGFICTGDNFKQKYGLFEAKIKMSNNNGVNHAFWLSSSKSFPQIDIVKTNNSKEAVFGHHWQNKVMHNDISKFKGKNFTNDYYIYSLEWTPEKLIWKINDFVVAERKQGIPDQEMFLVINSAILSNKNKQINDSMFVDWVKCYKLREN